jgi:hypothetical protein
MMHLPCKVLHWDGISRPAHVLCTAGQTTVGTTDQKRRIASDTITTFHLQTIESIQAPMLRTSCFWTLSCRGGPVSDYLGRTQSSSNTLIVVVACRYEEVPLKPGQASDHAGDLDYSATLKTLRDASQAGNKRQILFSCSSAKSEHATDR